MTTEDIEGTHSADDGVRSSGYAPELKRTLGPFQVFAVSFAFISVVVAVFATYGSVLQNSGPVGIWLWIVAAVGQTLVALVVAQFAARIALSGSSYQWASRLADPKVGWFFGWVTSGTWPSPWWQWTTRWQAKRSCHWPAWPRTRTSRA
jgi:amino acid permease